MDRQAPLCSLPGGRRYHLIPQRTCSFVIQGDAGYHTNDGLLHNAALGGGIGCIQRLLRLRAVKQLLEGLRIRRLEAISECNKAVVL